MSTTSPREPPIVGFQCVRVWCGGVLLCGAHGDWGARFYGAKWRRVFVSDVYGLQQEILRPDIYPPQASDLRPDSHQVR